MLTKRTPAGLMNIRSSLPSDLRLYYVAIYTLRAGISNVILKFKAIPVPPTCLTDALLFIIEFATQKTREILNYLNNLPGLSRITDPRVTLTGGRL